MFVRIVRFIKLDRYERRLFLSACFVSVKCYLITLVYPIRKYAYKLGEKSLESPLILSKDQEENIVKVRRAIIRVNRYTPWKKTCFTKAFTAKILLSRINISSTLYLGVSKDASNNLIAHAWLRCGDQIITGREQMSKYTAVAFFT